jgi:O-antigen ligase
MLLGLGPPIHQGRAGARGNASPARARVGTLFVLSLVWLLFEFGRPPTPPGIPLLISAALFVYWLGRKDKQWSRHNPWWFVLLAVVAVGVTFAPNTYSVYFCARWMATLFLGVCLPLQALITTVRRLRLWIYALIGVSVYVGAWAAAHGGYGPSGAAGGQDENYVAALMAMATALSYFSLFAEKRLIPRLLLGFSIVIFVAAIALGENASRGGFLALCAVALYGVARSPRKVVGFSVLAAGGIALFAIAGQRFWKEIDSTADIHEGTGDVRLELWGLGVRMWQAHPLLGVGAGNYRWVVGDYQTEAQMVKFGHSLKGSIIAHSLPVECIAELGSAGAIALLVLLCCIWRDLGKVIRQIPPPRQAPPDLDPELVQLRCYADALRGAILAIMVAGAFLSMLWYSHLWVLLAVGSAAPFVYRRIHGPEAGEPARLSTGRGTPPRRGRGLLPQASFNPGPGRGPGGRS